jgi:hypothetical protein
VYLKLRFILEHRVCLNLHGLGVFSDFGFWNARGRMIFHS